LEPVLPKHHFFTTKLDSTDEITKVSPKALKGH